MRRVLFVITGLRRAGAETQLVQVADGLAGRGYEVGLIYLTGDAEITPSDSRVSVKSAGMTRTPLGFVRGALTLRREILRFQPDLIHSHLLHANLVSRLVELTLGARVPLINTVHSVFETQSRALRTLVRITRNVPKLTTFVSQRAKESYLESGLTAGKRASVVYNGVDVGRFCRDASVREEVQAEFALPLSSQIVLAVGRLEPAKDIPNLMEAFSNALRRCPDMYLLIVGEGSQRRLLEKLANQLRLDCRVRFVGARSDIPRLMSAADIFVLSSAWEGFGLVVAEAMSAELFVVATDCGGVREVLGSCGRLVPPGEPEALADALASSAEMDVPSRRAASVAARERIVAGFSMHRVVEKWAHLYEDVCTSGRAW